ncbi:hypothetical protein [Streptomyces sp. NPDC054874]
MILEALVTAEPDLPLEVLAQDIDQVADTRAKLRRLAQALETAPDLLTSGRPEGPRLVELLVRTLRTHGASHLVLPRCAECGKTKPLPRMDGDRRLCSHCGNLLSGVQRRPCAVCGQTRQVSGWDREGRPRCQRHRPEEAGDVEVICAVLEELDTGLDVQLLCSVIELALPLPFQRRKVAEELSRRPDLLSGQGAYGSTRVVALIETLIAHGARSVVLSTCPFCHRSVALRFRRDGARCCRRCYDQKRLQSCSRCHRPMAVAARTPQGEPLCTTCLRRDPVNHETCAKCGRLAIAAHRTEDGAALCKRCWRPPLATCSICGVHKPCHHADTDSPRCPSCTARLSPEPCVNCGKTRPVWARTDGRKALCESCSRRTEPCVNCGSIRRVYGRAHNGALCKSCYPNDPASFSDCVECGIVERLHHFGLCARCAAPRQLRSQLAGPDGIMRLELEPLVTAVANSEPFSVLLWLSRSGPRQLLSALAAGSGPVTHEVLDNLTDSKAVRYLRAILVANAALPERDEFLVRFERWLEPTLQQVEDLDERRELQSYSAWFLLRRLRRRSSRRPLSHGQMGTAQNDIRCAIRLLRWLRDRGTVLSACTQADIDAWLASGGREKFDARNFLVWSVDRGRAHGVAIPSVRSTRGQALLREPDQRWRLSRRLLHDTELATVDRVAGCLVLLYGQPCTRIASLTTAQVIDTGKTLQLMLGTRPVEIPEPLSTLIRELVRNRKGYAVVGRTDVHPWLFPGGLPGRPISSPHLTKRLGRLGVPTRAGRATALMDLAGQLPSVVLSQLLGLNINTATLWSQEAGNTRPGYAAEVARRAHRKG